MAEVEIGIGKSGRQAYGLDDVAIVPSRRTRDPEDVDISWKIDAYDFELPLMASAMDGVVRTPIDDDSIRVLHEVHDAYDMHQHTRAGSPQSRYLTEDFVDRFAVVGPPEHCSRRLSELAALGIDKFVVVGPSMDADRDEARSAGRRFAREVLPSLKEA